MPNASSLIKAVARGSDREAVALLEEALLLEVDPLVLCMHRLGQSEEEVFARAAEWCELAFAPQIPRNLVLAEPVPNLDALADIRSARARLFERTVVFTAPAFTTLLGLHAAVRRRPELRENLCIVPRRALQRGLAERLADPLLTEARQRLARHWPFAIAHLDLSRRVRMGFALIGVMLLALSLYAPFGLSLVGVPLLIVFVLVPSAFRLAAALRRKDRDHAGTVLLEDADLPVYSVLVPLRDEARMVPQLAAALKALDYPPAKLDIKFVVEARSVETLVEVERELIDPRFELIVVPDALPRTKPKALNYALPFVRGAHVVVFDAEDIPEPGQLRLAASRFAREPDLHCLQAELVVDNARENWLTAQFAAEYGGLFGVMLPALARWQLALPLGGTSNHFRTEVLRHAGGWDAFNVTEDADLGVRLCRLGFDTAILASRTYEEAPITLGAWMRQRTRWMKGYMQTWLVHNRHPRAFLRQMGWRRFLGFHLYVGSLIFSPALHGAFSITMAAHLVSGPRPPASGSWLDVFFAVMLVFGYAGAGALAVKGLLRLGYGRLLPALLGLPFYWVLHTLATTRAVAELVYAPYFWAKTPHGLTQMQRGAAPGPGAAGEPGAADPVGAPHGEPHIDGARARAHKTVLDPHAGP